MRETPSGGVGSIQDQGVNYIQLNIQPPIPLLNTELRNATLNKDYERSTPLDQPNSLLSRVSPGRASRGQGWAAVGYGGRHRGKQGEFGIRASPRTGASPSTLLPFLPKPERSSPPGSAHHLCLPQRVQRNRGSSSGPQFPPRPSLCFPGHAAWRRRGGAPSCPVQAVEPAPLLRLCWGAAFWVAAGVGGV